MFRNQIFSVSCLFYLFFSNIHDYAKYCFDFGIIFQRPHKCRPNRKSLIMWTKRRAWLFKCIEFELCRLAHRSSPLCPTISSISFRTFEWNKWFWMRWILTTSLVWTKNKKFENLLSRMSCNKSFFQSNPFIPLISLQRNVCLNITFFSFLSEIVSSEQIYSQQTGTDITNISILRTQHTSMIIIISIY